MEKMEKLEVEKDNEKTVKTGFYVTKTLAIILGLSVVVIFTGSILATYFGKSCTNDSDKYLFDKCADLACSNISILESKHNYNLCGIRNYYTIINLNLKLKHGPRNVQIPLLPQPLLNLVKN